MNDVFISYAHIDDQALTEGQKGWITFEKLVAGTGFEPVIPRLRDYEPDELRPDPL